MSEPSLWLPSANVLHAVGLTNWTEIRPQAEATEQATLYQWTQVCQRDLTVAWPAWVAPGHPERSLMFYGLQMRPEIFRNPRFVGTRPSESQSMPRKTHDAFQCSGEPKTCWAPSRR
jgi:hypothetical protein